jgi:predicted Fe-Mo cluster-binding NifX family protein
VEVRIAVASSDGKVVNRHFGKADNFYILTADSENYTFRCEEKRKAEPVCHGGDHEDTAMVQAVKNLSDCRYVLVSRIGTRAKNECEKNNISVFEIPDEIDKAVEKLLKYEEIQRMIASLTEG